MNIEQILVKRNVSGITLMSEIEKSNSFQWKSLNPVFAQRMQLSRQGDDGYCNCDNCDCDNCYCDCVCDCD